MNAVVVWDEAAHEINRLHTLAQGCAHDAVKNGIRCGEMLLAKKKQLKHGKFMSWVDEHCNFEYSTAARYMTAARQSSTGVEILTLSKLFPSGRKRALSASNDDQPDEVIKTLARLSKLCRDVPNNKSAIIALLNEFKNRLQDEEAQADPNIS
jgi:hypothetical protein